MGEYEAKDIVSLSPGKAFRTKLGMYLSADKQEAINLGLRELVVNVQDEYEVYKPKNPWLRITIDSTKRSITVEDNMRGIPVGIRDDGINSLTAAFLIPHSGGKHESGVYASAIGVNGEGVKIVCHTAEHLWVTVKRDNKIYQQSFSSTDEGAAADGPVEEYPGDNSTGTKIKYIPDKRVYGDCFIDFEALESMLQEISMFTIGLRIELVIDGEKQVFESKNGLIDGLSKQDRMSRPFHHFYETDDCKVELALQWVTKDGNIKGYANGLYMPDGGTFISSFKSSLTRTFNSLSKGKYSGEQIRDVLDGYVSVKVKIGQFSNQAKTALANKEAGTATSAAITEALKEFYTTRKDDFLKVIELLDKVEKAEAAAEKARRQVLEATHEIEKNQRKKVIASDKLKDAEFLGEDSILLVVEGNGARGAVAQARDEKKYGIFSIRGKMINCFSNPAEKIFANEEIKILLSALGIIPGKYNSKKLRYGKLAICVDADSDGHHIALLISAAMMYLAPEFVKENRLCWLRTPLYIVTNKDKEEYYFSDEEFNKVRGKIKGTVGRNKGIGEGSAESLRRSMFTPEYQRLEILHYSPEAEELLHQLMGEEVNYRKEFIFNNVDFSKIKE